MDAPYLVLAVVTLISTMPSLFFSAMEMRSADAKTRVVAQYTTARSLALFVLAVIAVCGRFEGWLLAIAVAMLIVQGIDGVIALRARRAGMGTPLGNVIGPIVTAVASAACIAWFLAAG